MLAGHTNPISEVFKKGVKRRGGAYIGHGVIKRSQKGSQKGPKVDLFDILLIFLVQFLGFFAVLSLRFEPCLSLQLPRS